MSKLDIEKLIKQNYNPITPSLDEKIDISTIHISPRKHLFKYPIVKYGLSAVTMLLFALVVFNLSQSSSVVADPVTLTETEVQSFSAISTSVLIDAIELQNTLSVEMSLWHYEMQSTLILDKMTSLNPYFNLMELFVGNQSDIAFTDPIASTNPNYTYESTYQMVDLNGIVTTYAYYYNEFTNGNITAFDGLVTLGDLSYYIEGTKVLNDDNEVITTKTYKNVLEKNTNYILLTSSEANQTQSFLYQIYQNTILVEKTTLALYNQQGEYQIKLNYHHQATNTDVQITAKRSQDTEGVTLSSTYQMTVGSSIENGEMKIRVVYNETTLTNEYQYTIKNESGQSDDYSGHRGGGHH